MLPEKEGVGSFPVSKYFVFCDDQQRQHTVFEFSWAAAVALIRYSHNYSAGAAACGDFRLRDARCSFTAPQTMSFSSVWLSLSRLGASRGVENVCVELSEKV